MDNSNANGVYFLPGLFLRTPHYSFNGYDMSRLPEVLLQKQFQNAVWLASPGFYRALQQKSFSYDQLNEKEQFTVSKYYNRICFRPTPFGSFASFTMLDWREGKPVILASDSELELHTLPDQQLLTAFAQQQNLDWGIGKLIVNPCLYRLGKMYRYPQATRLDGRRYAFRLKALVAVRFNQKLISLFKSGSVAVEKILIWIEREGACTRAEALEHLHFLLEEQVLLSSAQGKLIYADVKPEEIFIPENTVDFRLRSHLLSHPTHSGLQDLASRLNADLALGDLKTEVIQPFYTALERPLQSGGPGLVEKEELTMTVHLLRKLALSQQPDNLTRFFREFRDRFDRQKVPLLLALDPDYGINYGSLAQGDAEVAVLENVRFSGENQEVSAIGWSPVHRMLFRLWIGDKLRDPWSPLKIEEEDLLELVKENIEPPKFPQTQALLYRRTGENLVIEQAGGVGAVSMVGRFSCFSKEVHKFCRELAAREIEANPDVVFADIGQFSDTHVDNINRRMAIYPYEIPINVFSDLPDRQQILPDDLLISVQGEELILESRRLKKRVIPRLSTAYNFRHNQLSVFRLLCDLQFQGLNVGLSLDLEQLFPELDFYPRVSYNNSILCLAKWNLKEADVLYLIGMQDDGLMTGIQRFRQIWHMPRHISLGAFDQTLVFDLAVTQEARFFVQCLKGLKSVIIREYPLPDRSVKSGNKPLAGQFIAFLTHDENIYRPAEKSGSRDAIVGMRNFMPGSNWLYLKIYCTPRIADAILSEVVRPFIAGHRQSIEKWFFIRYHDKGSHLRLRICATEANLGSLLSALQKRMTAGGYDKLISDYQLNTYRQEIERYGATLMPLIERVFQAGSELVIWFLHQKSQRNDWENFHLGINTANMMMKHFFPNPESRLAFIKRITALFFLEFGSTKQLKTDMDLKYRQLNTEVDMAVQNKILAGRLRHLLDTLKQIDSAMIDQEVIDPSALWADLIHMQMNRTFRSEQRKQEYLVYYFLERHEIAGIARLRR